MESKGASKENGSFPVRASVHNSRLVQYRLSRVRSTGQAKEKEERGSMKDSFRVGRVCNLVCTAWKEKSGEPLESSSKTSPLYFSSKNRLSILSRIIFDLDISEWNYDFLHIEM